MSPLLALEGVSLVFPRGGRHYTRVLANIDISLDTGELLAVLAQRAQGKTTLVRVAAGVMRPDHGSVRFDGVELWELSDRGRSALLGSDIALLEHRRPELDLRAIELVALPLLRKIGRRDAYAHAGRMLARVGLEECGAQRWESLSDSERALLTLARGLAREPRLLLIDDLMAGLGIGASEHVGRLLRELSQQAGFAVLMTVPDAGSTSWCDRVATLAGGELIVAPPQDNVVSLGRPRRALP